VGVAKLFFFNPNIHPLVEFRRRVKGVKIYLERDGWPAVIEEQYGLREYLSEMFRRGGGEIPLERRERCYHCYRIRLERAASEAVRLGLQEFSTTLLASREQDRDLVSRAGREAGEQAGARFMVADWHQGEPPPALLRGIYRQQYCGCVFSEAERYQDSLKHLYRPSAGEEKNGDD
jgi:predicted adenine nucleotide alpha hydrolase (AANH) superfamily ATPase